MQTAALRNPRNSRLPPAPAAALLSKIRAGLSPPSCSPNAIAAASVANISSPDQLSRGRAPRQDRELIRQASPRSAATADPIGVIIRGAIFGSSWFPEVKAFLGRLSSWPPSSRRQVVQSGRNATLPTPPITDVRAKFSQPASFCI